MGLVVDTPNKYSQFFLPNITRMSATACHEMKTMYCMSMLKDGDTFAATVISMVDGSKKLFRFKAYEIIEIPDSDDEVNRNEEQKEKKRRMKEKRKSLKRCEEMDEMIHDFFATPERKRKSDKEKVCPGAPKKMKKRVRFSSPKF